MKQYICAVLAAASLSGCGGEVPLEVSINEREGIDNNSYYRSVLSIRSVADSIQINEVIINRGNNCKVGFWHRRWAGHGTLKFGNGVSASIPCDMEAIKEVDIDTDQGSYTFSF